MKLFLDLKGVFLESSYSRLTFLFLEPPFDPNFHAIFSVLQIYCKFEVERTYLCYEIWACNVDRTRRF